MFLVIGLFFAAILYGHTDRQQAQIFAEILNLTQYCAGC